jgi:hypothetical protein
MWRLPVVLLALVVMAGGSSIWAAQEQSSPFRLTLSCSRTDEVVFRFTLQNVSADPNAAIIGMILGNDKKFLAEGFLLRLLGSGTELHFVDVSVPGIAGRVDPWLVMLPPGAAYSGVIPASCFRRSPELSYETFQVPARVQLHLTTRPVQPPNLDMMGISLIRVWTGTVGSNELDVPGQCDGSVSH